MTWGEWLALGIFLLGLLSGLAALWRVFAGPNRLLALVQTIAAPAVAAIIALAVLAMLGPTPQKKTGPALPDPAWAADIRPMLENWLTAVNGDADCAALEWQGRRFIVCAPELGERLEAMPYQVFRLAKGKLWPENGIAANVLSRAEKQGRLPKALGGVLVETDFLRDGGPSPGDVAAELARRLGK